MSVIVILLAASLCIGVLFLFAFIWSVRNGQFEDDYSPGHKILFDDREHIQKLNKLNNNSKP